MGFGYLARLTPSAIRMAFQRLEDVEWVLELTAKMVGGELTGTDFLKKRLTQKIQNNRFVSVESPPLPNPRGTVNLNILKKRN
jgi:hypothetical protein